MTNLQLAALLIGIGIVFLLLMSRVNGKSARRLLRLIVKGVRNTRGNQQYTREYSKNSLIIDKNSQQDGNDKP